MSIDNSLLLIVLLIMLRKVNCKEFYLIRLHHIYHKEKRKNEHALGIRFQNLNSIMSHITTDENIRVSVIGFSGVVIVT